MDHRAVPQAGRAGLERVTAAITLITRCASTRMRSKPRVPGLCRQGWGLSDPLAQAARHHQKPGRRPGAPRSPIPGRGVLVQATSRRLTSSRSGKGLALQIHPHPGRALRRVPPSNSRSWHAHPSSAVLIDRVDQGRESFHLFLKHLCPGHTHAGLCIGGQHLGAAHHLTIDTIG